MVHYQRRNGVFAMHDPASLDWPSLFKVPNPWLHLTGITPMVSAQAHKSWEGALTTAASSSIPISLDLNHRKQLGPLEQLWGYVRPHTSKLDLLILSVDQLNGLAKIETGKDPSFTGETEDKAFLDTMAGLQIDWGCKKVAICRKVRDDKGLQRRWSLLTTLDNTYSTYDLPVWHTPRDDLGGGSAWAAGMIHALHVAPVGTYEEALRRADLLSALCMETMGDFSAVTRAQLDKAESQFAGKEAKISSGTTVSISGTKGAFGKAGSGNAAALARVGLPPAEEAAAAVDATVEGLRHAGCLAILRVKSDESTEAAIARGVELAGMGCTAIEVTLDSPGWKEILAGLKAECPPNVLLGVGTVMDESVAQVGLAASLGAKFALSPIDPIGFVDEAHRHGVLGCAVGLHLQRMVWVAPPRRQDDQALPRGPRLAKHPQVNALRHAAQGADEYHAVGRRLAGECAGLVGCGRVRHRHGE